MSELPTAKPPFLRRVRIRGYKSIAFCDVTLEPLTILVGRNGSGKSNFVDALGFVSDLMDLRIGDAVGNHNGWSAICCKTDTTPFVEFTIEGTFSSYKSTWDFDYAFVLEKGRHHQIQVHSEKLSLAQHDHDCTTGFDLVDGSLTWFGSEHFESSPSLEPSEHKWNDPRFFYRSRPDGLLLSGLRTQPFVDLVGTLRSSRIYNFHPPAIRKHQPMSASPFLARDGANLARAIKSLEEIDVEALPRITHYLTTIVPGVVGFRVQEYGDFETVRFSVLVKDGQPPVEFDASSMSEGTLRVLASLISVHQYDFPCDPGLIGIEEPETGLHIRAIHALISALESATARTQILLTTHSPEVLEVEGVKPACVRVVQMVDGKTVIARLDPVYEELLRDELGTLGSLSRQRILEPDPEDMDRQINQNHEVQTS